MEDKQVSMLDLLIETHAGLQRQGPGSTEATVKALSFLGNTQSIARALDLGCGTGAQTMVLAQNIGGDVTGIDLFPAFINVLNDNAKKLDLGQRVRGTVGDAMALPYGQAEFDLVWSEGVIDGIGFEKGLSYWGGFLKKGGYVCVTCPAWLTAAHPAEVEKFWADAGSGLDSMENNIATMQKAGFAFVASFALPENCWTDNYFVPRTAAEHALLTKYGSDKTVEAYIESSKNEVELYAKYKQFYSYVFYIGKKI